MRLASILLLAASSATTAAPGEPRAPIESSDPFSPTGSIEISLSNRNTGETNKVETGELNGVHYRIYYSDGSAMFTGKAGNVGGIHDPFRSNWSVACKKDPITDKKHCQMYLKDLWIFAYPKGKSIVSIGSHHYPGSSVAIRIDQGTPIAAPSTQDGNFSQQASAKIIKQLASANVVATRYMKWPDRTWVDESWDLYGFNEAYKYLTWAVERIK